MAEQMRALGYLCPECGKMVYGERTRFAMGASAVALVCDCGRSELTAQPEGPVYRLTVPCGLCGGEHRAEAAAERLLELTGHTLAEVSAGKLGDLDGQIRAAGAEKLAEQCGVGVPTLLDVARELQKPGRDPRDELPPPILRTDVLEIKDLQPGMVLTGTVRNVIDFGVFVDIGVHQDGLVHISQISEKFLKHPSEALAVGDVVKVKVLEVDEKKKRISLSIKQAT